MADKLYTTPQAAKLLGVSSRSLYRWLENKEDRELLFPGLLCIRHEDRCNYYFSSSQIRNFNTKHGKPGTRAKRFMIRPGGKK